jgi:hypothetical protein
LRRDVLLMNSSCWGFRASNARWGTAKPKNRKAILVSVGG